MNGICVESFFNFSSTPYYYVPYLGFLRVSAVHRFRLDLDEKKQNGMESIQSGREFIMCFPRN